MKNVNWKTVTTTLVGAFIIAFVGGVLDFQNMKAAIVSNTNGITEVKTEAEKQDTAIRKIGAILCFYATRDKVPDAKEICKDLVAN